MTASERSAMREEEMAVSRIMAGPRRPPNRHAARAGTRPTTERVREALFSALAAWAGTAAVAPEASLAGLAFCDLYAGSGAVGLEAASRGAGPVLLVESDRRTAQLIRRNAAELGLAVQISTARRRAGARRTGGDRVRHRVRRSAVRAGQRHGDRRARADRRAPVGEPDRR